MCTAQSYCRCIAKFVNTIASFKGKQQYRLLSSTEQHAISGNVGVALYCLQLGIGVWVAEIVACCLTHRQYEKYYL
jgi:hypothetical protein